MKQLEGVSGVPMLIERRMEGGAMKFLNFMKENGMFAWGMLTGGVFFMILGFLSRHV